MISVKYRVEEQSLKYDSQYTAQFKCIKCLTGRNKCFWEFDYFLSSLKKDFIIAQNTLSHFTVNDKIYLPTIWKLHNFGT